MLNYAKQKLGLLGSTAIPMLILAALLMAMLLVGLVSLNAHAANTSCGTETVILSCPNTVNPGSKDVTETGVWGILLITINILTVGVGVAALAGIVYGVILYTISRGDPGNTKKSIEVLRNVVIGIAAYALMWSLLNWLVPGGVFK